MTNPTQNHSHNYISQLYLRHNTTVLKIPLPLVKLNWQSNPSNKRPGPEGFSALYYKKFSHVLTPMLTEAFNSLLNNQSFRSETLTAIITMIPKPQSDDSACANYRPISLLNLDIKLLAKVMAFWLNNIIGSLINKG